VICRITTMTPPPPHTPLISRHRAKWIWNRSFVWTGEKWYRHTYKPYLLKPFLFIYTNGAVNGALWGFSSAEWRCQTVVLCACDCVLVISVSLLLCLGRYSTFTWYLDFFFHFLSHLGNVTWPLLSFNSCTAC